MPGGSTVFAPESADDDVNASTAGLLALAAHGIPVDIQELLVRGNPSLGIPPGALSACIKATILSYRKSEPGWELSAETKKQLGEIDQNIRAAAMNAKNIVSD